jgi:hypothetical protein
LFLLFYRSDMIERGVSPRQVAETLCVFCHPLSMSFPTRHWKTVSGGYVSPTATCQ